ncbi:hypothetical protein [Shewanella maritima]|uniref:hypothetical protein n=1 Tax=Shewanella maritima TaxID=2520507 RepID=UPI003734D90E
MESHTLLLHAKRAFSRTLGLTLLVGVASFGTFVSPNAIAQQDDPLLITETASQAVAPEMEIITVIYRDAFNYALYQQTSELITAFRQELTQDIMFDARNQSKTMAQEFGISLAFSAELEGNPNSLQYEGVIAAPQ